MKNTALLVFILSFLFVSCGDDSGSSVNDANDESEISSSSSSKANKDSKPSSSSSSKANKNSKSSSSSNVKNKSSSSSSKKAETLTEDIQNWKDTTEGTIRKSNTTDTIYIFDNKKWRVATLPEASLGGCNEKSVSFFGYAEERLEQDLTDPRTNKCTEPYSSYCYHANYHPDFYICQKDFDNKFYWEHLDAFGYDYICNDSSYYANNNDIHWGGIDPIKCVNCKQEIFDYFENI
ncbi:MAG: hypothetical protein IJ908_07115, partial [Fibrobacter sp.]|nr:hypothetical protein [Fibrobacter sp.]